MYGTIALVVIWIWIPNRYTNPVKRKFLSLIEPHREYMGEKTYRTKVFWSTVIYTLLGVTVFSYYNSYLSVVIFLVVMHILDFIFYLISEKYFKIEPELWVMKVREWRSS
jgi:hypothetical protein